MKLSSPASLLQSGASKTQPPPHSATTEATEEVEDTPAPAEPPRLDNESLRKNFIPALEKLITQSLIRNEVSIPHPGNIDFDVFRKAIDPKSLDIRSSDFARCDLDGLDLSHLGRRVPAPPVPSKRMHVEKQVQPNRRSHVERRTTSGAGPSRTVNTRESRGRATFEQAPVVLPSQTAETRESRSRAALERIADHLRSAGHVFVTPIILHNLPSDRIHRLTPVFRAEHAKAKAKTASERLAVVEKLNGAKNLCNYLTRYHQLHLRLNSDAKKLGQQRNSPEAMKKMQEEEGMTPKALGYHLGQGKSWKRLCEVHCGLLPLTSCFLVTMGAKFSGGNSFLDESEFTELEMMMQNATQNEAAKKLLALLVACPVAFTAPQ
ncbi:lysine -specific demethylase 4c [Fusarium agapanthi]|uniref:Lysine -specific demethylase 4c n=1 Tax=Fusarium agapanthi TaxID=1803897 RepID=A0A9P5B868_9HYPO|nr:lysine -specific demethylase 4c [Fusarium agapanthi]